MLTDYIQAALHQAHYELENGTFYGEIPGFAGIVASGHTLEACREQLQDVLEGWLIVGIRHGHSLPVVQNIDLNPTLQAGERQVKQVKLEAMREAAEDPQYLADLRD